MKKSITGFLVPDAVAFAIKQQIMQEYEGKPVWVPEVFPVGPGQSIVCASSEIFEMQITAGKKLKDLPLAQQLLSQLGGWGNSVMQEIDLGTSPPH